MRFSVSSIKAGQGSAGRADAPDVAVFLRVRNHLMQHPNPPPTTRRLATVVAFAVNARHPEQEYHFLQRGNAMEVLFDILASVVAFAGHAIELVVGYVETHHWIFGFLAGGYIFYLHDRGLHARLDALDKRIDEIRKRLAVEY
jgi:hypothetical protein